MDDSTVEYETIDDKLERIERVLAKALAEQQRGKSSKPPKRVAERAAAAIWDLNELLHLSERVERALKAIATTPPTGDAAGESFGSRMAAARRLLKKFKGLPPRPSFTVMVSGREETIPQLDGQARLATELHDEPFPDWIALILAAVRAIRNDLNSAPDIRTLTEGARLSLTRLHNAILPVCLVLNSCKVSGVYPGKLRLSPDKRRDLRKPLDELLQVLRPFPRPASCSNFGRGDPESEDSWNQRLRDAYMGAFGTLVPPAPLYSHPWHNPLEMLWLTATNLQRETATKLTTETVQKSEQDALSLPEDYFIDLKQAADQLAAASNGANAAPPSATTPKPATTDPGNDSIPVDIAQAFNAALVSVVNWLRERYHRGESRFQHADLQSHLQVAGLPVNLSMGLLRHLVNSIVIHEIPAPVAGTGDGNRVVVTTGKLLHPGDAIPVWGYETLPAVLDFQQGTATNSVVTEYSFGQLLTDLRNYETEKRREADHDATSREHGAPTPGSKALHYRFLAIEAQKHATAAWKRIPKSRGVDLLKTICDGKGMPFAVASLKKLSAESALSRGMTSSDVENISLESVAELLRTAASRPASVNEVPVVNSPPPVDHLEPNGVTDNELCERACEPLTTLQTNIIRFVWKRKHSTGFNTLAENCWPNGVASDETIIKRLRDIEGRWDARATPDKWFGLLDLEISPGKRTVKLVRSGQSEGQK
ncbi:MAG: hypothetical protein SH850_26560 [Planctomycetaceae bacterium]|nr:hypothetical protein [Planctomycetaceae bacterium]